jgi:hypothetical protein
LLIKLFTKLLLEILSLMKSKSKYGKIILMLLFNAYYWILYRSFIFSNTCKYICRQLFYLFYVVFQCYSCWLYPTEEAQLNVWILITLKFKCLKNYNYLFMLYRKYVWFFQKWFFTIYILWKKTFSLSGPKHSNFYKLIQRTFSSSNVPVVIWVHPMRCKQIL